MNRLCFEVSSRGELLEADFLEDRDMPSSETLRTQCARENKKS